MSPSFKPPISPATPRIRSTPTIGNSDEPPLGAGFAAGFAGAWACGAGPGGPAVRSVGIGVSPRSLASTPKGSALTPGPVLLSSVSYKLACGGGGAT